MGSLSRITVGAIILIPLAGCTLLSKKQTRHPQGLKSVLKLAFKSVNETAEALRRGEKDMEGKNLQRAPFQDLDLRGRNFKNADLEQARLQRTVWEGAEAQGAVFTKCRCQEADFQGATLRESIDLGERAHIGVTTQVLRAIFKKAKLQRARMEELDLRDLDFRGANIRKTQFHKAQLQGADFRGAKNWEEANWYRAVYDLKTKFPEDFDPKKFDMRLDVADGDFSGKYVGDLDLENAINWEKVSVYTWQKATYRLGQNFPEGFDPIKQNMLLDLSKTNIEEMDVRGMNFWDADLEGVNLSGKNLANADFRRVRNLEEADLTDTYYGFGTKFPEGFNPQEHGMILRLKQADLRADLRGKDLRHADFGDLDLEGVDLSGVELNGADLSRVRNWEKANWEGAYFDINTKIPQHLLSLSINRDWAIYRTILDSKMILDLRGRDLKNMNFVELYKSALGLKGYTPPIMADLRGANLENMLFGDNYNLSQVRNLEHARLEGGIYTDGTIFPEGFNPREHGMSPRSDHSW